VKKELNRRDFLRMFGALTAGAALAACQPQTVVVKETVQTEKEVTTVVKETVKETVVVEGTPKVVEKEVTKVVKEVVTATPAPAGPVTIRFPQAMGGDEGQMVFEEVAARFQEKHPNVTVKVDPTFDWDAQKYLVQAAAGTAPDVLWGDEHWVYNLSSKGVLLDLEPFMDQSGFKKDDFEPLFQYFAFQGKQYGLALWWGCYVLYYNQSLFDEAGISHPTDEWTYDDMLAAALKLTKDTNGDGEPDIYGFLCQTGWANPWGALTWAYGGEYFNEDGTEFLLCKEPNYAGLQWYLDLIHKHHVAPTPEIADALAGGGDPFMLGNVAMKTASPWGAATYRKITDFVWDIAGMPIGPKGRYSVLTTDSLSIYRGSAAPDVAWAFIEELLTEDSAKIYCTQFKGPIPALKAGQQYFILPGEAPANQQAYVDAVKYARVPFQSPYSYVVESPFYQALGDATSGLKSLSDAMSGVCESINTALADEVETVAGYAE
jgi:multiple sugar transport system substrate-binding protein